VEELDGVAGRTEKGRRQLPAIGYRPVLVMFFVAAELLFFSSASGRVPPELPAPKKLPPNVIAEVLHPTVNLDTITKRDFERAMIQAAAQDHLKRVPRRGQRGHWKLKAAAIENLLDESWIEGQAAKMEIIVTRKEVAALFARIKRRSFKDPAGYKRFLHNSHLTQSDVNEDIRLQLISTAIQARILMGIKGRKARQQAIARFVAEYARYWRSHTVCAPKYVVTQCSNGPSHGGVKQPLGVKDEPSLGRSRVSERRWLNV
jgi:hypothetical protein